jgi:hypothetical protein
MTEKSKTKKPLRRASNGRFAENTGNFTPEEMAKAIAEFQQKPGEPKNEKVK